MHEKFSVSQFCPGHAGAARGHCRQVHGAGHHAHRQRHDPAFCRLPGRQAIPLRPGRGVGDYGSQDRLRQLAHRRQIHALGGGRVDADLYRRHRHREGGQGLLRWRTRRRRCGYSIVLPVACVVIAATDRWRVETRLAGNSLRSGLSLSGAGVPTQFHRRSGRWRAR